jgi:hypothetical protein
VVACWASATSSMASSAAIPFPPGNLLVPCTDLSLLFCLLWTESSRVASITQGKRPKQMPGEIQSQVQGENYGRPSLKGDTGNGRHTTIQGPALALKCGHPFFTRLSAVRHLLCIRGHACNLHLGIPCVFQIYCAEGTNKLR